MSALSRLETRIAAVRLEPKLQANASERSVFVSSSKAASHHSFTRLNQPRSASGARRIARASDNLDGAGPPRAAPARPPPRAVHDDTPGTWDQLSGKLDELSSQLSAAAQSGDGPADSVILSLTAALQRHAALSREVLERERDARLAEVARLNSELTRAQEQLARQSESEAARIARAVDAERVRCHAAAAAQLSDALFAAEVRANDELEQLTAQHAREAEGLRRQLARLGERLGQ